jgi:iron complex outermembrane recepter protein
MKNFITTLLFAATATATHAQNASISGKVADNSKKPIAAITVSLLQSKDSSLVKTGITDANGSYDFSTNKTGQFLLQYSGVGYVMQYSPIFDLAPGQKFEAATATLQIFDGKLKEVTIIAKKPLIEVKADKTVFNVEASINATGSNAMELLQKSPGVQVDNNDNISMKGKTGVRVYVDGKMTQLETRDLAAYLRSINSNDIEAIEMISNPSAKYDASGNAGIVNIRLKKNKKYGTNGSVNGTFIQGITPKANGSVNLNYRDKKINIFSNIGGNIGMQENTLKLYRIQKDTLYNQRSTNIDDGKSFNIKAGADYFINSKHTIGVIATTNSNTNTFRSTSLTPITYVPTNTFEKTLQAFNTIPGSRTNANFNLNYRYADTSGLEVNFDGDYGLFRGVGRSYQPNNYLDANNNLLYSVVNRNHTPTDIDIYTAKIDIERRLGKGKLGFGGKYSYVFTENSFEFFNDNSNGEPIKQLDRSNDFEYTEKVAAGYINYQQQLSAKWSLQAGLRAEQTNSLGLLTRADGLVQDDNRVKRSYLDFFPSAAVSFNINAKHSLSLTYSKRIDRPTYQDLNPFENKLDELTFEKGNAFLRPQYTNNVELTHTFMGFINTSIGYSHVRDFATQATDTIKNATFVQQKNLELQQIYSFNIGAPTPIKPWWNGYVNIWFNHQQFNGKIGVNVVDQAINMYGGYLQQAFTLGKDYSMEISGWFSGPSVWGGTWRTRPQGGVDLGVQKQLLQKKATIKVSVTDIFFTSPWSATNDFGGVFIRGGGNWESRTARLSFSYRFGSSNIKKARERSTGLESEKNRIKGSN